VLIGGFRTYTIDRSLMTTGNGQPHPRRLVTEREVGQATMIMIKT
jgi:hypothetical protein